MRNLTEKEIATLTVYGCTAESWNTVWVHNEFNPKYCANVHFSGEISLGLFEKVFQLPGGLQKHSGIYNSAVHNCTIGNDVYINHIHNYMANYKIEDEVFIEHVDALICTDYPSFGNGTMVNVLIESGQRAIPIFEDLSNVTAYLMTFYRHLTEFTDQVFKQTEIHIRSLIDSNRYPSLSKTSENKSLLRGYVGRESVLTNCGEILNVNIGANSEIRSAAKLSNGTIAGNKSAPVTIGVGVIAEDFIIQSGAKIDNGSMISKCLIGQGTIIDKQFSVMDSVFFANCQGFHGEAVSVFAGPFTVSHHRSTLLLASLYSFYNAGSGTNFSNHMYKLGPVHQGITERGVKTSSNSYIMWPARIGAFNVVLGSHKGNPDLSNLPFSYLMEVDGESVLVPGINMQSAGTARDFKKWAERDNRKDTNLIDIYHTEFLNPYLIQKMIKGQEILQELIDKMDPTSMFVWYQNCKIKKSSLKKGIEIYQNGIDIYLMQQASNIKLQATGSTLQVDDDRISNTDRIQSRLEGVKMTEWVDLAGYITSSSEVERLINNFISTNQSIKDFQSSIKASYNNRQHWEIEWVSFKFGYDFEDLEQLIAKGKKAEAVLQDMIQRDARKEYNSTAKTGFGIDGNEDIRDLDFLHTRGTF